MAAKKIVLQGPPPSAIDLYNAMQAQAASQGQPSQPLINKKYIGPVAQAPDLNTVTFLKNAVARQKIQDKGSSSANITPVGTIDPILKQKIINQEGLSRTGQSSDLPLTVTPGTLANAEPSVPVKTSGHKGGGLLGFLGSVVDDIGSAASDLKDDPVEFAKDSFQNTVARGLSKGMEGMELISKPVNMAGTAVLNNGVYMWRDVDRMLHGDIGGYASFFRDPARGILNAVTGTDSYAGADVLGNITAHKLDPNVNDEWWQSVLKNVGMFAGGTAIDIATNPLTYVGIGGAAELLGAPEYLVQGLNMYDKIAGSKTLESGGRNVGRELVEAGIAPKGLEARLNAVARNVSEGMARKAGGLPWTKHMTTGERDSLISELSNTIFDYKQEEYARWWVQNGPSLEAAFGNITPEQLKKLTENAPELIKVKLLARDRAFDRYLKSIGTKSEDELPIGMKKRMLQDGKFKDKIDARAEVSVSRYAAKQIDNIKANHLTPYVDSIRHRGAFHVNLPGGGKYEVAPKLYEKATKLGDTLTDSSNFPEAWKLLGGRYNPVHDLHGLFNNADSFFGKLNGYRQEAMSESQKQIQDFSRQVREVFHGVSKNNEKALARAIHEGTAFPKGQLTKGGREMEDVRQDIIRLNKEKIWDQEELLGVRNVDPNKVTQYDPRYVPLDLRVSSNNKEYKEFKKARKAEFNKPGGPKQITMGYDEARRRGLHPNKSMSQAMVARYAKTHSTLRRSEFNWLTWLGQGMKGKYTEAQAKAMDLVKVSPSQAKYIDEHIPEHRRELMRAKGEEYYLPKAMTGAFNRLDDMLKAYDPHQMKRLMRFFDGAMAQWKFLSTIRHPTQTRNVLGDIMTAFMDNIGLGSYGRYAKLRTKMRLGETPADYVVGNRLKMSLNPQEVEDAFQKTADIGGAIHDYYTRPGQGFGSVESAQGGLHAIKHGISRFTDMREKAFRGAHYHEAAKQELAARLRQLEDRGVKDLTYAQAYHLKQEAFRSAQNRVNKFHVDYSNLTPFELRLRRVVPFYTYIRGITPTIVGQAMTNPGRLNEISQVVKNMPQLWGEEPAAGGNMWDSVIPPYRSMYGGVQLTDEREPLFFDNRNSPQGTVSDVFGGGAAGLTSRLNPLIGLFNNLAFNQDTLGRPTGDQSTLEKIIGTLVPGAGDTLQEKAGSFFPHLWDYGDPMKASKDWGAGISKITEGQQIAELKNQNKDVSIQVAELNQQAQEAGYRVEKDGKGHWRIVTVDPGTGRRVNNKVVGTFQSPGEAQKYLDRLMSG